jgi:hypothetical protein
LTAGLVRHAHRRSQPPFKVEQNDRARFDNSVRNGKNQMPPWKDVLIDEEIDQAWY